MARLRSVFVSLSISSIACGGAQGSRDAGALPPECAEPAGAGAPARVTSPLTVISGGTVMTAAGAIHRPGYVVLEDGRITAVGAGAFDPPPGAVVFDATGHWVTPGIIDTHSHLGVYPSPSVEMHSDGNEATSPTTPGVQALHSVWPEDPGFERAIAGGVTALQILPGSANLVGGRGFVMKNRPGARNAEELRFPGAPETLKMACGENPKRVYGERGQMPSTRMGSVAVMRQAWTDAQAYREEWDDYERERADWCAEGAPSDAEPVRPGRDLGNEALAGVLRGEILPQIHCYRADEMLTQIQLADEFGFSIRSFHHATDAYKIRDVLAEYGIGVSTWADWWGFKIEAFDSILENAALVHAAGARAIIHSDSAIGIQRLNQEAAKAWAAGVRAGLDIDENDALRWVTANPAWALGVDAQTGTLEVGKMADVVVWDADPLSVYARATSVWVDGRLSYERESGAPPWSDFELGLWPDQLGGVVSGFGIGRGGGLPPERVPHGELCVAGADVETGGALFGALTVCFDGDEISFVGRGTVPDGIEVVDGSGMVLTAGLVELRTELGLVEISGVEQTRNGDAGGDDPVRAAFRAVDALNADTTLVAVTRDAGVTSVVTTPSGGLISGQGVWLDLVDGTAADMAIEEATVLSMALGNGAGHEVGGSRGMAVLRYREYFEDARVWALNGAAFESAQLRDLALSRLDLAALQPVLAGAVPVLISADARSDLRAGLALAAELGLRAAFSGARDGWALADELARAGTPVVVNPLDNLPASFESLGSREDAATLLWHAGVRVILSTGQTHNARTLRQVAGNAVRAGLPWTAALRAVTAEPAEWMGLGARYGTLEEGKIANAVLWSGDPFEVTTHAVRVWVRGAEQPLVSRQRLLLERYLGE